MRKDRVLLTILSVLFKAILLDRNKTIPFLLKINKWKGAIGVSW